MVLGSEDHFVDAMTLLDYGFAEFTVVTLVARGDADTTWRLSGLVDGAVAPESFDLFIGVADALEVEIVPEYVEEGPVLIAQLAGTVIGQVPLETADRPSLPGFGDAFGWVDRYWSWMWGSG